MQIKCLEIRDEGTCIPVLAIRMEANSPIEDAYLYRCGYPQDNLQVILVRLADQKSTVDPYEWASMFGFGARTMHHSHLYILKNWDKLHDGCVVDVRVILEEAKDPAPSEVWTRVTSL